MYRTHLSNWETDLLVVDVAVIKSTACDSEPRQIQRGVTWLQVRWIEDYVPLVIRDLG
jgi:hypothetical protein